MAADDRARQIFQYFKKYNYEVKGTGEVITFSGLYASSNGQAAAVTFYTFISKYSPSEGRWPWALQPGPTGIACGGSEPDLLLVTPLNA